jgi:hypothetical protein
VNEIALNLWDADEYGDGTNSGFILTAYPLTRRGIDTGNYKSVRVCKEDLPKNYVVDDEWAYPLSRKFKSWSQLFIAKQLEETND